MRLGNHDKMRSGYQAKAVLWIMATLPCGQQADGVADQDSACVSLRPGGTGCRGLVTSNHKTRKSHNFETQLLFRVNHMIRIELLLINSGTGNFVGQWCGLQ